MKTINLQRGIFRNVFGIVILCSLTVLSSCSKKPATLPVLVTDNVSGITRNAAMAGGNITDDGGADISSRGICWSTSADPTTANNVASAGIGSGAFIANLTSLTPNTTYYVRAYATNSVGTSYGNQVSFTTPQTSIATLSTTSISSITAKSALSGGNITDDGGTAVTVRGLCWSLTPNPTILKDTTKNGSGTGVFEGQLTNLTASTTYYIRAYAINSLGTAYGNQVTLMTTVAGPGPNEVFIQGFAFNPSSITVTAGTTVTWTNKDASSHTVTDDNGGFDSGTMATNATYSHTYSTAGTFPYHCAFHPGMTATVIVN